MPYVRVGCRITIVASMLVVFVHAARCDADRREGVKPNVVFILADDLGWSDTTLYGTTDLYQTPNIERLAKRGMTFTNAYSASPLCSPTRASILTGLNPARLGLTSPNCHLPKVVLKATETTRSGPSAKSTIPAGVTRLDPKYKTLAEKLQENGYVTGHFGKWHLGAEPFSPLEHGFGVDIPHWYGPGPAGSYVAPWKYPDFDPQTPNEHIEDRMAKEAVAFIEANQEQPFFLNYWMFSVHAPFDAKADLIAKYRGIVDPKNAQRSPTYAAMIESMDDAVGTLLDALDRFNLADDTIIVFASDNGGNMYNEVDGTTPTSNAPLRGGKATMYEGGIRGPAIVAHAGVIEPSSVSDEIIQSVDYYPTLLEMLDIPADAGQTFDGISIVSALHGGDLSREAIFTYFPHEPRVPDWLPPSVSVRTGDWKLIRLFHHGENGEHRYKLFNLANDIGETTDLSDTQPDLVTKLDAQIEAFLVDTEAARPLPNPAFDPSKYRIEDEGVSRMNKPKKSAAKRKPAAGWLPGGTVQLENRPGDLLITSTGRDPYFSRTVPKPIPAGKLTVRLTMQSTATGAGQIFWKESNASQPFAAARSVFFDVTHDGESHTYLVPINAEGPLVGVRLDPARGAGEIVLSRIEIIDSNDRRVFAWPGR